MKNLKSLEWQFEEAFAHERLGLATPEDAATALRAYVASYEPALASQGTPFGRVPLRRYERDFVTGVVRGRTFERGQCFKNCQSVVFDLDPASAQRLRYCDGIAWRQSVPMPHAWLVLDDTKVIDVTWTRSYDDGSPLIWGDWDGPTAYWGTSVPREVVLASMRVRRVYSPIYDWSGEDEWLGEDD